jgi:hypothetical protein
VLNNHQGCTLAYGAILPAIAQDNTLRDGFISQPSTLLPGLILRNTFIHESLFRNRIALG